MRPSLLKTLADSFVLPCNKSVPVKLPFSFIFFPRQINVYPKKNRYYVVL